MRYKIMEFNRRLKNPEYAQTSWSQEEFPEPAAPGAGPEQEKQGGGVGAPGAAALNSFLAPQEGDFDPSRLESLEGTPPPAVGSQPATLDRFAESMKARLKPRAAKMRGELTYE